MPFDYKLIGMVKQALAKQAANPIKPAPKSPLSPPPGYGGDAIGVPTYQKAPEPGVKWLSETERKQKMLAGTAKLPETRHAASTEALNKPINPYQYAMPGSEKNIQTVPYPTYQKLPTELSKTPFDNLNRRAFLKGVGLPSLGTGKVNYGY